MTGPPPELTSWVSLTKDIVTGCAAVVGAAVALRGLNAWRQQLKGKTDCELARKLLKASYKVREEIRSVRHPAIWSNEAAAAEREVKIEGDALKENPNAARAYAVYQMRWNKLVEAVTELEAEAFEAEISWGEPAKAKLGELLKLVAMLRLAVSQHIEAMVDRNSSARPRPTEIRDILYDTSEPSKPDDFALKVQIAVAAIEAFLRPHLGSR